MTYIFIFYFFFQAEDGIRYYKVTGVQTCAFFFKAEDGIRAYKVTGVQTCALPILPCCSLHRAASPPWASPPCLATGREGGRKQGGEAQGGDAARCSEQHGIGGRRGGARPRREIGRASCRERG